MDSRTGSPNGSRPTLPTVQSPKVKWSSGFGANSSRDCLRGMAKYGATRGGLSSQLIQFLTALDQSARLRLSREHQRPAGRSSAEYGERNADDGGQLPHAQSL